MSTTVNLREARKSVKRAKKRTEGTENALKFGQTKAEKQARLAEFKRAQARFEAHKRDGGNDGGSDGE